MFGQTLLGGYFYLLCSCFYGLKYRYVPGVVIPGMCYFYVVCDSGGGLIVINVHLIFYGQMVTLWGKLCRYLRGHFSEGIRYRQQISLLLFIICETKEWDKVYTTGFKEPLYGFSNILLHRNGLKYKTEYELKGLEVIRESDEEI